MQTLKVSAPAKLNLSFDITGTRPDGYHDVESLFQAVDLQDELEFSICESEQFFFNIHCDNPYLKQAMPLDDKNLIGLACKYFLKKLDTKKQYAINVHLEKQIPIGAGLAGGSSNAAATLIALNHFFSEPFSLFDLKTMAAEIGSDVAFCLEGGCALGKGRGEILSPVKNSLSLTFCLVKPRALSVSTPWAFAAFDRSKLEIKKPDLANSIKAVTSGDLSLAFQSFGNVFEPVLFEAHPDLKELKQTLLDQGAWFCQMTGSGPTLFAVTANREKAQEIRRHLLKDDELGFSYWTKEIMHEALPPLDIHIATSIDYGARVIA
jgi:4-diphosphocytidyl-2-C-methyl-D-erythritol kinase